MLKQRKLPFSAQACQPETPIGRLFRQRMKLAGAVLLLISAAVPVAAIFGKEAASPVRRVVGLLQDLEKKLEEDANTEKDLFEKFKCWSETTLTDKKAAVAKANKRIEYLNSFMADVKSGALSFTSERETLTEAVATAQSQLTSVDMQHNETATKLNVSDLGAVSAFASGCSAFQKTQFDAFFLGGALNAPK